MNKRMLWALIAGPGLAMASLLLVFFVLGRSTVEATPGGAGAVPDLQLDSGSVCSVTLEVDGKAAAPGERRTYQIVVSPGEDSATARLTDTLPSAVTWAGDLAATSGSAGYSGGTITWNGSLTVGQEVTITYGVTVIHTPHFGTPFYMDIYTDVINDAVLDDGQGNIIHSNSAGFAIGRPFGTGSDRTFAIDLGDADNDGDLDVAVGGHTPNQVCWNNGDGTFQCEDAIRGDLTFDVEWGDMNTDGFLDVVVARAQGRANLVCTQIITTIPVVTTTRTFTCTPFGYCAGPGRDEVCHVALENADCQDGLDIAVGTRYTGDVFAPDIIYYNDGNGTFPITRTACQGHPTLALEFGNIDGDEDPDLVVVGHWSEYICINSGDCTGVFTETRWLHWRLDKNTGGLAVGKAVPGGDPGKYQDVAVGREDYSNEVYLNNGSGAFPARVSFGPVWEHTWDVDWGDADGDGDLDLAAGNSHQPIVVHFNDPLTATTSITFTKQVSLGVEPYRVLGVAFGDVDGDGDLDLAMGNDGGQNVVYLNTMAADLAIVKAGQPAMARAGDWLTYTLVYSNGGVVTATSVLITDVVPAILTGVSATSSGALITPTKSVSYTWQVEDLSPGEGGAITITGQVSPSLRCCVTFTNTAQIATATRDPNPINDISSVRTGYCLYLPLVMRGYSH